MVLAYIGFEKTLDFIYPTALTEALTRQGFTNRMCNADQYYRYVCGSSDSNFLSFVYQRFTRKNIM